MSSINGFNQIFRGRAEPSPNQASWGQNSHFSQNVLNGNQQHINTLFFILQSVIAQLASGHWNSPSQQQNEFPKMGGMQFSQSPSVFKPISENANQVPETCVFEVEAPNIMADGAWDISQPEKQKPNIHAPNDAVMQPDQAVLDGAPPTLPVTAPEPDVADGYQMKPDETLKDSEPKLEMNDGVFISSGKANSDNAVQMIQKPADMPKSNPVMQDGEPQHPNPVMQDGEPQHPNPVMADGAPQDNLNIKEK